MKTVVYFYDFLNADGKTDFRDLSDEARDRAGRGIYLNDAFIGLKTEIDDARLSARAGNQKLRWSDSPSFGQSIAPVNPVSASRRYQPGNTAADAVVAVPMLTGQLVTGGAWTLSSFYQFGFTATEPEAAGTFLSANDYYSPGSRFLQLGQGSPLVPDEDASVTTPATPFGSRVSRSADRMPRSSGQFGVRLETPEFGEAKFTLAGYAMHVHSREPIVSVHTGTLGGLLGVTAQDYASSGSYFLEYPEDVTVVGGRQGQYPAPLNSNGQYTRSDCGAPRSPRVVRLKFRSSPVTSTEFPRKPSLSKTCTPVARPKNFTEPMSVKEESQRRRPVFTVAQTASPWKSRSR